MFTSYVVFQTRFRYAWLIYNLLLLHGTGIWHKGFWQCSPKYSAFYSSAQLFQLDIWPYNSHQFGSFGHWPPLHIHPLFWTKDWMIGTTLRGWFNHASTPIRAMHCLMWTLFIAKHVSFVIRLIMFRPSVNTALDRSEMKVLLNFTNGTWSTVFLSTCNFCWSHKCNLQISKLEDTVPKLSLLRDAKLSAVSIRSDTVQ